eukprot:scaffold12352_cov129-Isochrysis_galbana.AAC.8
MARKSEAQSASGTRTPSLAMFSAKSSSDTMPDPSSQSRNKSITRTDRRASAPSSCSKTGGAPSDRSRLMSRSMEGPGVVELSITSSFSARVSAPAPRASFRALRRASRYSCAAASYDAFSRSHALPLNAQYHA